MTQLTVSNANNNATIPFVNPVNGHTYFLTGETSWDEAQRQAKAAGGYLVTINNIEELDWLNKTFHNSPPNPVFDFFWIGLNDVRKEGTLEWSDGEATEVSDLYANSGNSDVNDYGALGAYEGLPSIRLLPQKMSTSFYKDEINPGIVEVETCVQQLTAKQLEEIMPEANPAVIEKYLKPLNGAMQEFEINTPKRQAAFIAQVAQETGQFGGDLGKRFQKTEGMVEIGAGGFYRGRGLIHLTGRRNYAEVSRGLNLGDKLVKNPELVSNDPTLAARTAGYFWKTYPRLRPSKDPGQLNKLADSGSFREISLKVNGRNKTTGNPNGWAKRQDYYAKAKEVIGSGNCAQNLPVQRTNSMQRESLAAGYSLGGASTKENLPNTVVPLGQNSIFQTTTYSDFQMNKP